MNENTLEKTSAISPVPRQEEPMVYFEPNDDQTDISAVERAAQQTKMNRRSIEADALYVSLRHNVSIQKQSAEERTKRKEHILRMLLAATPEEFLKAISPMYIYTLDAAEANAYKEKFDRFIPDSATSSTLTDIQKSIIEAASTNEKGYPMTFREDSDDFAANAIVRKILRLKQIPFPTPSPSL